MLSMYMSIMNCNKCKMGKAKMDIIYTSLLPGICTGILQHHVNVI